MIALQDRDPVPQLKLQGVEVSHITIAVQLQIVACDTERDCLTISISTPFRAMLDGSKSIRIDPEQNNERLGAVAVGLRHQRLVGCTISADGTLYLDFDPAVRLTVPPDDEYEAWELDHSTFNLQSEPGGHVAIIDRRSA